VKKISFVAHSLGGLVARYAIGRLYEPNNRSKFSAGKSRDDVEHSEGLIAGLEPMNFITFASPHLGSSGNKQVILICFAVYITRIKSISLLFPVLTSHG
jgi:hypothetical protein